MLTDHDNDVWAGRRHTVPPRIALPSMLGVRRSSMRKANELIGKSIVAQGTGERLARVYDVVVDHAVQRLVALLIESGGWVRDARVVPWNRITSIGDVILVRGDLPVIV